MRQHENAGPLDVEALLAQLTPAEKAALTSGAGLWSTVAVERLGLPAVWVSDGPHGLRKVDDADPTGPSMPATCFPTAAALGSSWDQDLLRTVGEALGREARAEQVAVLLGPGVNIKRSPLCGRNFEYLSEDPVLAGELGAAYVQGVQSQGVGTSLKHFAANNQETDRLRVSADVSERALREIYLPAFERVVRQSQPWTIMAAYNRVNGTFATQHGWLLTEVLRGEWGFEGLVVSDWGAVVDRVAALAAGCDLEMPPREGSAADVLEALRTGALTEAVLDVAARRVVSLVNRALPTLAGDHSADLDAHHDLARAIARECAVLLQNRPVTGAGPDQGEAPLLPLGPSASSMLAVIGEFARTPRYQGAGSSLVVPTRVDAALDEIRALAPAGVEVAFAPGFALGDAADDGARVGEAVALATRAETVVLFLGLPAEEESEGFDRRRIDLPEEQLALLRAVAGVNPRVVVVLANGGAVAVDEVARLAPAVLEGWLLGQAGGGAVADLLFGVASPSGRLAETLPLRLADAPSAFSFPGEAGHSVYGEGVFVGYRGYDVASREVAFPFGHGLTYTTFEYSQLRVDVFGAGEDVEVCVACEVRNVGPRAGREVVQVYVGDVEASVARPVRELKAFDKVTLEPGESAIVGFELDARDFSFWSSAAGRWVLEAGEFEVAVGASSRDLRLRERVRLDAVPVLVPLHEESTLIEWATHPVGSRLLREALGDGAAILDDDEHLRGMGTFPLSRLAAFPGLGGVSQDVLRDLVARAGEA